MSFKTLYHALHDFFFTEADLRMCGVLRIMTAFFLFLNMSIIAPDLLAFFGPTGLVDRFAARSIVDPDVLTLFDYVPQTDLAVVVLYVVLMSSLVTLGIGLASKTSAAIVFVLYTSFIHRNVMIFDGEDVVFRLFCFFLIFSPSGRYYSTDNMIRKHLAKVRRIQSTVQTTLNTTFPVWPLRLFQIQMTLIYLSTSWEKMKGQEWLNGTSMYYIFRLEEFVRFPVPEILYTNIGIIKFLTWTTVAVELFIPIFIWFKETRLFAIIIGISLHLSIEYQMNLNMFQWIMITGLLSFIKPADFAFLALKFQKRAPIRT